MNSTKIKENSNRKIREDEVFYLLGKILILPFCLVGIWFVQIGYSRYGDLLACAFHRVTGFPCPGCGGTRALYLLLQGDVIHSFLMNPTVLYGALAYMHFMILFFVRKNITKTIVTKKIHIQYYMYTAIAVILGQWIVKLIVIISHLLTFLF